MANLEGGGDKDTNLKGGGYEEGEGPDPGSGNVQRKPAGRVKPSFLSLDDMLVLCHYII